jgi:hypothetical protein
MLLSFDKGQICMIEMRVVTALFKYAYPLPEDQQSFVGTREGHTQAVKARHVIMQRK